MNRPIPLNLTAETVEVEDPEVPGSFTAVATLCVNGKEIWRDPDGRYVDTWGDGRQDAADVVCWFLEKILKK